MKQFEYIPRGVCARKMFFEIDENTNTIVSFQIVGGCSGNTQGVSKLIIGKKVEDVINTLEGIKCMGGGRGITSCPDQVAQALKQSRGN